MKVNEIFYSIQGEGSYTGYPCVFIRFTGCNLRCIWCDSQYAFYEGEDFSLDEIVSQVNIHPTKYVEITGGEPLLQQEVYSLMARLIEDGKKVLLETSGSVSIENVSADVHIVLDLKPPSSGEVEKNLYGNLEYIKLTDDVKIVIQDEEDFYWAVDIVKKYKVFEKIKGLIFLQPVNEEGVAEKLAVWIRQESSINRSHFRLGLQLQKCIYGDKIGV